MDKKREEQLMKEVEEIQEDGISKEELLECYYNIIEMLKKYCDIREDYYSIVALWILGTYFHQEFQTYPYLFLNAMKGSGKTRLLKLITVLSKGGEILTSLSEAVLFRTTGTLGIDEFEGISRTGSENLRELLNSCYKKGSKVKRMKKKKTIEGEEQVVEEFSTYRPICMANINGMENVLGDRCITLLIQKSNDTKIIKLMELFDQEPKINYTKKTLISKGMCSVCSIMSPQGVYENWNNYITNTTITTHTTHTHNNTKLHQIFKIIDNSGIDGRNLEISMPLIIMAMNLSDEILNEILITLIKITKERKDEDMSENNDVLLIDFVSQEIQKNEFESITDITNRFKQFHPNAGEWINSRWIGKALKRVGLVNSKKRLRGGNYVILDVKKAQEKIRMFK